MKCRTIFEYLKERCELEEENAKKSSKKTKRQKIDDLIKMKKSKPFRMDLDEKTYDHVSEDEWFSTYSKSEIDNMKVVCYFTKDGWSFYVFDDESNSSSDFLYKEKWEKIDENRLNNIYDITSKK